MTVSVDAVVYYRIYNPTVSVANVANAAHSTQLLAQTTLRNVLGTKNLGEILSDRDQISESMQVNRLITFSICQSVYLSVCLSVCLSFCVAKNAAHTILAQAMLRNVLGTKNMGEVLSD